MPRYTKDDLAQAINDIANGKPINIAAPECLQQGDFPIKIPCLVQAISRPRLSILLSVLIIKRIYAISNSL